MAEYSAEEMRQKVMALARKREYWLEKDAPRMKKNIRRLTKPHVYAAAGLELLAVSEMTFSTLRALDKKGIKELAWKLAWIRLDFVELLTDCDARNMEAAERAEEAML